MTFDVQCVILYDFMTNLLISPASTMLLLYFSAGEEATTSSQTTQTSVMDLKNTDDTDYGNFNSLAAAIFGGLAGLMILGCCFIICK